MSKLKPYFQLTKPSIMLLVLITGGTALFMEGGLAHDPLRFGLIILGLYLTGGSANALNQYFERDVDARMTRTRHRRPLPSGQISPKQALIFSISIGITGVLIFGLFFNLFSALLALGTILFYSLFYTLWLKPNTEQNIVIGGAAGAMGPIIAWAAASGSLSLAPWLLFLIIFLWTPPHFWALALFCKADYVEVGYPMMPVAQGDDATLRQIFYYTLSVVAISLSLYFVNVGVIYLILASILGGIFIAKVVKTRRNSVRETQRGLFGYSILYLFALFVGLVIDGFIHVPLARLIG